jgi:polyhydroxyalkanoate synthesis regulator phasin
MFEAGSHPEGATEDRTQKVRPRIAPTDGATGSRQGERMRKTIVVIGAAALLLVGASTVLAAPAATNGLGVVTATIGGAGDVLSDVLDELVGAGTIDQTQADAIEQAVEDKRTELQAEREALREQMETFLEDGVLSAEELAQLPADHPLRNLDQFLEDGQLTTEELRQLRGVGGFGHRGHGHGPMSDPDDSDSSSGAES